MDFQVQVVVPRVTGLPEDDAVMTWNFQVAGGDYDSDYRLALATKLISFYQDGDRDNGWGAGIAAPTSKLSSLVVSAGWDFKFYTRNVVDNSLSFDEVFGNSMTGLSATAGLPEETALRLTAHAVLDGTEADRTRRGGWFFGPGIVSAGAETVGGRVRPTAALRRALLQGARWLLDTQGDLDTAWVIYSEKEHSASPVFMGFVDDAFDTIRKRGPGATVRDTFTATP